MDGIYAVSSSNTFPMSAFQKQAFAGNLSGRKGHIFVDADIPGIGILLYLLPEVILYDARVFIPTQLQVRGSTGSGAAG